MESHSSMASGRVGIEAVALTDDAVDFGLGGLVKFGGEGLVLDGGDGVLGDVLAGDGEELHHGGEGDVDLLVVAIVVAATDLFCDADDLEAVAVDGDEGAYRGAAGEEEKIVLLADDGDEAFLGEVVGVEEAALRDGEVADSRGSSARRP